MRKLVKLPAAQPAPQQSCANLVPLTDSRQLSWGSGGRGRADAPAGPDPKSDIWGNDSKRSYSKLSKREVMKKSQYAGEIDGVGTKRGRNE